MCSSLGAGGRAAKPLSALAFLGPNAGPLKHSSTMLTSGKWRSAGLIKEGNVALAKACERSDYAPARNAVGGGRRIYQTSRAPESACFHSPVEGGSEIRDRMQHDTGSCCYGTASDAAATAATAARARLPGCLYTSDLSIKRFKYAVSSRSTRTRHYPLLGAVVLQLCSSMCCSSSCDPPRAFTPLPKNNERHRQPGRSRRSGIAAVG
jgi:hypothetical protein